jgi:hypothetical protein
VDVFADEAEGLGCGVGDVAVDLAEGEFAGAEAEGGGVFIAWLNFEAGPVDCAAVETWGRAGFEAALA